MYDASTRPASSFETSRARFLGEHEYGTWASPLSLQGAKLSDHEAQRGDNIAALLHPLGPILPGQTVRLITQLGQAASLPVALEGIRHYRQEAVVEAALRDLAEFWDRYLCRVQVATPDLDTNRLLTLHTPEQAHDVANHILQLLDEGREAALIFHPSLVT